MRSISRVMPRRSSFSASAAEANVSPPRFAGAADVNGLVFFIEGKLGAPEVDSVILIAKAGSPGKPPPLP